MNVGTGDFGFPNLFRNRSELLGEVRLGLRESFTLGISEVL